MKSHQGDKYATPDSTRGRVDDGSLRVDHRRLFILCWAARASNLLITPLLLNDRARFAHVNGDEALFKLARVLVCLDHDDALKWQGVVASMPKSPRNRAVGFSILSKILVWFPREPWRVRFR